MAAASNENLASPRASLSEGGGNFGVRFDLILARADTALRQPGVWFASIAFVVVLQAVLIFSHHPWLDEWQALQIALQSPTPGALMRNLRYEGHPPLWYLALRLTAFVVPTYHVLPAVAAVCAAATQAVILTRAPFPRLLRLALSLHAFVLFEYLTLSRSMTLGVACAVAAVALRHSRWRWLPIALLPFCDFLFGVISVVLVTLAARDRTLWWPGVALWIVCASLSAWSVVPAPDMVQALKLEGLAFDLSQHFQRLGVLLVPWQTVDNAIQWNGIPPLRLGVVSGPLFVWFAWRQTRHDAVAAAAMVAVLALTTVFSVAVYPLHTRHLSLVALILILLKWHGADRGAVPDRWFAAWLLTGAACGLAVAAINLTRPFDTAHLAAEYIRRHDLQSKHWLVWPESRAQGISAMLGIEVERMERDCSVSFVRWNYTDSFTDWPDVEAELRRLVRLRGRSYLVSDNPIALPRDLAVPVAAIPAGYDGYAYYITLIGPNAADMHVAVPPCVPGSRALARPTIWSALR